MAEALKNMNIFFVDSLIFIRLAVSKQHSTAQHSTAQHSTAQHSTQGLIF
ncbi:hypothetical protein [Riemerella columbipharyngis]|nr:hypothetical protein [Riemerella columbipharyngis]